MNHMRLCLSPNSIKHKHITQDHTCMPFPRHSLRTCNSTVYANLSSMHEHTKTCECVI